MQKAYNATVASIKGALQQPIYYVGLGQWTIFDKPRKLKDLWTSVVPLPGTRPDDACVMIRWDMWSSFQSLSLWIEALSIHEWCLLSERMADAVEARIDWGRIYFLLTARPDNRRPLTWERNHIEVLMMEGVLFTCPWTRK